MLGCDTGLQETEGRGLCHCCTDIGCIAFVGLAGDVVCLLILCLYCFFPNDKLISEHAPDQKHFPFLISVMLQDFFARLALHTYSSFTLFLHVYSSILCFFSLFKSLFHSLSFFFFIPSCLRHRISVCDKKPNLHKIGVIEKVSITNT